MSWGPWQGISEGSTAPGTAVTAVLDGDLFQVFVSDPAGGVYTARGSEQAGWGPWQGISEGSTAPGTAVTAVLDGDLFQVFVSDPAGGVYTARGSEQAGWGPWQGISEGSTAPGTAVTAVLDGDLFQVFVSDPAGGVYTARGSEQAGWGPWQGISEGSTAPGTAVTAVLDGDLFQVFVSDPAGGVYTARGSEQAGWGPWQGISEGSTAPGTAVTAVLDGDLFQVFVSDPAGGVYTARGSEQAGWGLWQGISEGSTAPGTAVTAVLDGDLFQVFVSDPAGGVYTARGSEQAGWGPWQGISEGSTAPGTAVTAVLDGDAFFFSFVSDPAGGVYTATNRSVPVKPQDVRVIDMANAYRVHSAFVELDSDESATYRLPPMTAGVIAIDAFNIRMAGRVVERGGAAEEEAASPRGGRVGREGVELARGGERATEEESAEEAADAELAREVNLLLGRRYGPGDLDLDPGVDEGGYGPATGLTLELLMGGNVVASGFDHIYWRTPNAGDIWTLRLTRTGDGPAGKRRYMLEAIYPSVLPLEKRRIPMEFFRRGFDANWNVGHQYITSAYVSANTLQYSWDPKFAGLYHLRADAEPIELASTDWVELPYIRKENITFLADAGPDPNTSPPIAGEQRGEVPYFELRVDCAYEGSREADLRGPGNSITLPEELWFELRFFLVPWGDPMAGSGGIGFVPRISSPLLDMLNRTISYPSLDGGGTMHDVNLKEWITNKIERAIYQLQMGEAGNSFDAFIRPWLVGHYDVERIYYDRDADEMVIDYAGRAPVKSALEGLEVALEHEELPPQFPRLFETPDELPARGDELPQENVRHSTSPGALAKIEHIVVLMQENRSFDQVLGYLSRDKLQDDVDGLLPGDNDRDRIVYKNVEYRSRRSRTTAWPSFALMNPCHDHACVERQISEGMKGLVADYAKRLRVAGGETTENLQRIMDYHTDEELPTYAALVREFAICDRWFCSHPGPTLPNRFAFLTGDLNLDRDGLPEYENPDLAGYAPSERPTLFDLLTSRGVTWKVFEHGYSFLRVFRKYTFDIEHIVGFADETNGFAATAASPEGLPQVTLIEPDYIEAPDGNDDHAPADMLNGQILIAKIVRALVESAHWDKTLFIITYDEHGGFYDHVLPPKDIQVEVEGTTRTVPIPPLPHGAGVGPRVPTFVISPLIEKGSSARRAAAISPGEDLGANVSKTTYDHTTVPATILRRFCSPFPPSMGARTDGANDLRELLTLDEARPRSDFQRLLTDLRAVENLPTTTPAGPIPPPPMRKPQPDPARPEDDSYREDFHGFVAYASSLTGLGRH